MNRDSALTWVRLAVSLVCLLASTQIAIAGPSFAEVIESVQPKIVKIHGAGGLRSLEAYQSGFLISEEGHIVTVWSYVLDTDEITVTLNDGRKFKAQLLGADPRLELAVLKIDAAGLQFFDIGQPGEAVTGSRILAFSNLFNVASGNEPASVQRGSVMAKTTLAARRGAFESPYKGPVYVLDAVTNNPGAAGGALVTQSGQLLGMLGKELRNALNNSWLNYAIPIEQMRETIDKIIAGDFQPRPLDDPAKKPPQSLRLDLLGIVLVPDVLERTPPFIDEVRAGSPAAKAGLKPDDLVVFVNDRLVQSAKLLIGELEYVDREDEVKLTVIRGQELIDVTLGVMQEN